MGVRLYVTAEDAILREVAGVSEETAAAVNALHASHRAFDDAAHGNQDLEMQAYDAYIDGIRALPQGASLYANLTHGDGFNRFQGHRSGLDLDENCGEETRPGHVAILLETQKNWAAAYPDGEYACAFYGALDRAREAALRGDLTVYWG